MRRLVLATALVAAVTGCHSYELDRSGREPLDTTRLAGTWVWEQTVVCGAGIARCAETTPASAQRAETLTFTPISADGASGRVEGYFNGGTIAPMGYEVRITDRGTAARPFYFATLVLDALGGYNQTFVSASRLVISDAAVDGGETTYRRR